MQQEQTQALTGLEIAIVGMAGRFPGAGSVAELWHHLQAGREGITRFTDAELAAAGVPAAELAHPAYVKARGALEGADHFDAAFFGISPREAEVMDPQHRLFLETAWEALEDAGYDPGAYPGSIGVYAGAGLNNHVVRVWSDRDLMAAVGSYQAVLNNDKDFLATRAAYKLGLRGPALTVQTACSTSLVAVHLACRALLGGECAMALAGGVAVSGDEVQGYVYQEGGIRSPDGRCRTFDAGSGGTVGGSGVALVVLKRLDDALADGDTIHAVIKGSAINNDGDAKVGYTAPAEDGQLRAVRDALDFAEVTADTVGYVEAHGTATHLGDPIEVAALTRAYRADSDATGWCALGSVKSAVGHLDAAAGVTGLIKAAAAVRDGVIPPMVHFRAPNPALELESSPFYVPAQARAWRTEGGMPRRAGVSSFGIGGTNAHAVLEQAPAQDPSGPSQDWQLLVLSARTEDALGKARAALAAHLRARPGQPLADVAHTLRVGRAPFRHRVAVVCRERDEAAAALEGAAGTSARAGQAFAGQAGVAFLFPGQGSQHVGMGEELYRGEPVFRAEIDRCAALLLPKLGFDLRDVLYPTGDVEGATARLTRTAVAQPAIFALSYALAKLWMHRGITPDAMLGHSIGEYAAACLAGVFSLEDALALVAERGRLMDALPSGAMMAVSLPEAAVLPLLGDALSLAAVNGPAACVVSGPEAAVEALRAKLEAEGEACRRLHTSHAFHSAMMDPALDPFTAAVRRAAPRAPERPFLSNLTGTWITAAQATDPGYWAAHLRGTVRFAAGVAELTKEPGRILLEVGPGRALATLARRLPEGRDRAVVSTLRAAGDAGSDAQSLLEATGAVWTAGARPEWASLVRGERRRRVQLPTYPFERRVFRLEPRTPAAPAGRPKRRVKGATPDVADWFYRPVWTAAEAPQPVAAEDRPRSWLVFADPAGLADRLAARLREGGAAVNVVRPGEGVSGGEGEWTVEPGRAADYDALFRLLAAEGIRPDAVAHLGAASPEVPAMEAVHFDAEQDRGWFPLLHTAQALARHAAGAPVQLWAVTAGACPVAGDETIVPARATVPALLRVIAQEYPDLACRAVDFAAGPAGAVTLDRRAGQLMAEIGGESPEPVSAWRGRTRWVQAWDEVRLDAPAATPLRQGGVYVITGGLGGLALVLAEHLAGLNARLVLVGRTPLPAREEWDAFLASAPERSRTAARIRRVRRLEALGAEVLVAHADAADASQLRRVLAVTQRRWGAVNGVFHAAAAGAGEGQAHTAVPETGREQAGWHFRPKAHAALALDKALRGMSLDFVVLYSSLSAVLGGLRFAAYASSNAWLDAFAHHAEQNASFPWISIGWDGWRNDPADGGGETGIAPAQGMDALERILAAPAEPQLAVCTGSLHERLDRWVRRAPKAAEPDEPANGADAAADPRRHLSTPYAPPQDELQERIAGVWSELLGAPSVGIHDDFLELGGHSLLGIQVLSRLRRELQVDLSVDSLFRAPTVAELAAVVEAAFMAELAELSEEEALTLVDG
jgi:acyl transferase domain-containing protein